MNKRLEYKSSRAGLYRVLLCCVFLGLLLTACSGNRETPEPTLESSEEVKAENPVASANSSDAQGQQESSSVSAGHPDTDISGLIEPEEYGTVVSAEGETDAEEVSKDKNNEPEIIAEGRDIFSRDVEPSDKKSAICFSKNSGFYKEEFTLEITSEKELQIFYTLDGSDPRFSETVTKYEAGILMRDRSGDKNVVSAIPTALYDAANVEPISKDKGYKTTSQNPADEAVDKCNVVRAYGVDSEGNETEVVSGTFFIGSAGSHIPGAYESARAAERAGFAPSLMVISITANEEDFFDYDTGIYVKGVNYDRSLEQALKSGARLDNDTSRKILANYNSKGREWERSIHVDFFECGTADVKNVLSQDCGVRIQGNYSRSDLQKGLRLYARSEYGKKNFKYPVFGEDCKDDSGNVKNKFKTLTLRNGGNLAFISKYSDNYWQYVARDLNCESMASRPAVVYLNGEYWGLYVLEETYDDDFFEDTHGVNKDDVVLYKGDAESYGLGYKLDIGELPDGEKNEGYYLEEVFSFLKLAKSLKSDKAYERMCELVDPDSVMDYFAFETWINNKWDWPGKNWSIWKTTSADADNPYADGRWRFCFYDLEFGGVSGKNEAQTNTIKEDNYKPEGLIDTNTTNPVVLIFAYMMQNEGFRNEFYDRLRYISEVICEKETALKAVEDFKAVYGPLYEQFFLRYPGMGSTENSLDGGYGSGRMLTEFIEARPKYIETMIKWTEKHSTK